MENDILQSQPQQEEIDEQPISSVPLYSPDEELPWKPEQLQKAVREKRIIISSISSELHSEINDQFTIYRLIVELQMDTARVRWELDRRYNQFFQLHSALKRKYGDLPNFPSKTIFADKNSESIVNQRLQDLQSYLTELLQKRTQISAVSPELHDFLETRKRIYGHGPVRRRILFPLPATGFDVSQVSVAWKQLNLQPGYITEFCVVKESGANDKPVADVTLSQPTPLIASMLAPNKEARLFYREMEETDEFQNPLSIEEVDPSHYDAIVLTGGYSKGVFDMVNNEKLQDLVKRFWASSGFRALTKVCAAIDRGTLLLAKSILEDTGKSVIHKRKTTTLPKWFEKVGTYLNNSMNSETPPAAEQQQPQSCLEQVKTALEDQKNLLGGPISITTKGTWFDDSAAFIVEDQNYLSGRWTGDIYLLSKKLIEKLDQIEIEVRTPKPRAK